ncbi:MAG: GNAT family N-acetyltransferase [Ignavibacteriaceae bacterium]|nr:GNAT family N-acetyltransferase [Ignavibacteriaceae bacterium]
MEIEIRSIKDCPEMLSCVLDLHKTNSKTLGFLPEQVFKESAEDEKIIIAIDKGTSVIGYLLFNINKHGNFIYITHLCVSTNYRNQGIAKLLFRSLIDKYEAKYRGVRVTCREDYFATKVWEKLGFTFVHEKPGRSKGGSVLFVWWFDFNHPDLFSVLDDNVKLKVVLDSNIVYDLMEPENCKTQNSYALLSDWLTEYVDYYVPDQLKNDISHHQNKITRLNSKIFIGNFKLLTSTHDNYFKISEEIKVIYNKSTNIREEADIRHITKTINSDASYFLTKDEGILRHSKEYIERYGLLVLKPEEFIIQFNSLINDTDYQPSRLCGTNIQKKAASIEELREIPSIFFQNSIEKKKEFENKLKSSLVDKRTKAFLIKDNDDKVIIYTIQETEEVLEIQFLRYIQNLKARTIINQILHDVIYLAREKHKKEICISEVFIDKELESILLKYSFIKVGQKYFKFIGDAKIPFSKIKEYLNSNIKNHLLFEQYSNILSPYISDKKYSFLIEKYLFPLKIVDSNIPCFIVPIKPHWAMNLFNVKISEQDLFGGDAQLLFNKENVYYRSAKSIILENNSRILWYISKGKNKSSDIMNISASSYLNEFEINKPKHLYAKYKRLGIYKWKDIMDTAKGVLENDIMSFSFDLTENFSRPINTIILNKIYNKYLGKNFFFPQQPYRISEEVYFEIYSNGFANE